MGLRVPPQCRGLNDVGVLPNALQDKPVRDSTPRMFSRGYSSRRFTSKTRHSSATSRGRDRERPVHFSILRNRWRIVLG